MKPPSQTLTLDEGRTISLQRIAAYRLMDKRLKITVKTVHGEYSVYLYDALALEKHAVLRTALPQLEQRATR